MNSPPSPPSGRGPGKPLSALWADLGRATPGNASQVKPAAAPSPATPSAAPAPRAIAAPAVTRNEVSAPAEPPQPAPSQTGSPHPQRMGKYDIVKLLGKGAMGVVYKGFDPLIQRAVAIKVIHKELLGDENARVDATDRFRNEAQAVGRLMHTGIVAIYEFGEDDSIAYIAMEFVDGRNLDAVLRTSPLLSMGLVHQIMGQLLDALQFAHQAGVWHRDIKPANLMLTADGQLKLTDFGIARIQGVGLTRVSSSIGTPGFMAPEQYIGEGVDQRCDIFAAGVLYYMLLTGHAPFAGSPETAMYKIFNEQPTAPSQVQPGRFPAALDAVVARALSKRMEDRYASASEFKQAIAQVLRAHHSSAPAPAPTLARSADDATVVVSLDMARAALAAVNASAASAIGSAVRPVLPPQPPSQTASQVAAAVPGASPAPAAATDPARSTPSQWAPVEAAQTASSEPALTPVQEPPAAAAVGTEAPASATTGEGQPAEPAADATGGAQAVSGVVAHPAEVINEAQRAQAQKLLSRVLGPIAKVIVKRAADKALSLTDFVEALIAAVDAEDRERVRSGLKELL